MPTHATLRNPSDYPKFGGLWAIRGHHRTSGVWPSPGVIDSAINRRAQAMARSKKQYTRAQSDAAGERLITTLFGRSAHITSDMADDIRDRLWNDYTSYDPGYRGHHREPSIIARRKAFMRRQAGNPPRRFPGQHEMVILDKSGNVIQRSRNLVGIRRAAGQWPMEEMRITRLPEGGGHLHIRFKDYGGTVGGGKWDGATFDTDFASYSVLEDFIQRWRNVKGVKLTKNPRRKPNAGWGKQSRERKRGPWFGIKSRKEKRALHHFKDEARYRYARRSSLDREDAKINPRRGANHKYRVRIPATQYDGGYELVISAKTKASARKEAKAYCAGSFHKITGKPKSAYRLPRTTKITEVRA